MSFDKMHLFADSLAPRYERIRECIRMSVLTSTPNGIYNKHVPREGGTSGSVTPKRSKASTSKATRNSPNRSNFLLHLKSSLIAHYLYWFAIEAQVSDRRRDN